MKEKMLLLWRRSRESQQEDIGGANLLPGVPHMV
jgi:hypothetical protein